MKALDRGRWSSSHNFCIVAGCTLQTLLCAQETSVAPTSSRVALTIYSAAANNGDGLFEQTDTDTTNGGYAVVRDRRHFDLKAGSNLIQVDNVARYLDAGALDARAIDDVETSIASQRFDDQTLSFDTLVQRHIGHPVEILTNSAGTSAVPIDGTLLSNEGGLTVQLADGRVATVTDYGRVTFPDLPKGMTAMPVLRLEVIAKQSGVRTFEFVYPTQGIAWRAEYSAWIDNRADCKLTLAGWAQIANRSGAYFHDAQIKLVTGTSNRVGQSSSRAPLPNSGANAEIGAIANATLRDYHEYSVDNAHDIADSSVQRVALFAPQPVACQRQYVFEATQFRANPAMAPLTDRSFGASEMPRVRTMLALHVDRDLPAGRVRLIEDSSDGAPQFIGDDAMSYTPKSESIVLQVGESSDLRGERRQTDFQINNDQHWINETFALRVRNTSAAAKSVLMREHLYRWSQWNITSASTKFEKRNPDTVEFSLDVPANGEATVTYTAQYQWSESFK